MHSNMQNFASLFFRTAAVTLLATAGSVCLHAQSQAAPQHPSERPIGLKASLMAPVDLARPTELDYSSSVGAEEKEAATDFGFAGGMQPPPRRRYGRINYSDRAHNPDGSNKYSFAFGGGFTTPTGDTGKDLTINWKFQGAAGYNFDKKFGIQLEYNYDKFNLTNGNIQRQLIRYNALGLVDQNNRPISFAGLDGSTHIWSLTLNPKYTFYQGDATGAYVIGGGGFYRKVANWTLPQTGLYCDFFGFCYSFTQNQTFDKYSNNAGGLNIGFGFTYRLSRFASENLYAEARYVWVDNQPSTNSVGGLYPENNKTTRYIPVTVGIRF